MLAFATGCPKKKTCEVDYTVVSRWDGGFIAEIVLENLQKAAAFDGWILRFARPAGQTVEDIWNGVVAAESGQLAIRNESYNAYLGPNQSTGLGFRASFSGEPVVPSSFTLNGEACRVAGASPSATPAPTPTASAPGSSTPTASPPPSPTPTSQTTATPIPSVTPTATPIPSVTPTAVPSDERIVGYFVSWGVYDRNYHVSDIPADKLTHINYAFANVSSDGRCLLGDPYADIDKFYPGDSWDAGALRGNFHQLQKLKRDHPHVKTLISVGGWTWSGRFSDAARTAASRATFAQSCVQFMLDYGFDGIDIDWEYPVAGGLGSNVTRPEDKENYTLLLKELRDRLDAQEILDGSEYLLTIAAPAGPSTYANYELDAIADVVDWLNLMAYDFHGTWESTTGLHTPLFPASDDPSPDPTMRTQFNVDAATQAYLAAGVPADKLVLGMAFYGRGWSGVGPENDGLFQSASGPAPGSWEPGNYDYKDLVHDFLGHGYARSWHPESLVPWLHSPSTGVMITYDDPESIGRKTDYVIANGLGGAMFWELSGDTAPGPDSLLDAIHAGLNSD